MRYKVIYLLICNLGLIYPANALEICGSLQQGGYVIASDNNLQKIIINNKEYVANDNGKVPFAFARDADLKQKIDIFYKDGNKKKQEFNISATKWVEQKINGIENRKVNPLKEDLQEINKEYTAVRNGLKKQYDLNGWEQQMIKPVEGKTSGFFGNQRIFNGVRKNPHQGWDIAAIEGTEIKAMADGVVTLSDGPFFYSGNMIILNHGAKLSTIYAHLQKILVKENDNVKQGQVIGLVGKTGRVTGAHLHLGASLNGIRFDAQNLLNKNNNKCIEM